MKTYITRRLIQAVVIIILVSLAVFFVMRLLPGDPLLIYLGQTEDWDNISPERMALLRHEYGLDKPIAVQYVNWVVNIFRGDLGKSIFYHEKVSTLIMERFPITLYLGLLSTIFSSFIGVMVGVLAAIRRGKWLDNIITPLTYIGITIPVFWLGILLIYLFGLYLGWLPICGYTSPFEDFWMSTKKLVMPVICLSVAGLAGNARQMRSSMLEVVRQDYIRTAWSKGLSEGVVIGKHALKNSVIPVVTMIGIQVGHIFGGSVFIETVFAIPGIGRLLVNSIFLHDYVVVQAILLIVTVTVLLVNLIVDLSYAWLDPRIRYR